MLRATFLTLSVTALISAFAAQVPLASGSDRQAKQYQSILAVEDAAEWSLDKLPNTNTTDHLVFETVYSLLQRWPNTRMRNGHNIVPGSIPAGTLLYYGTSEKELPPGPDWAGMDPEHSYFISWFAFNYYVQQPCWFLTLATTRPLKVVYFDGSSAAKFEYGSLDTQDLIIWGELGPVNWAGESQRIQDLCEWGKRFGVDGFVRMETDFEIMLCDFTSGVRPVSFVNLTAQEYIQRDMEALLKSPVSFEVIIAGSWHNHFPGESRIQLDLPGLVSFYDAQLVPSLVGVRADQERWDHRARNVSSEDLSALKSRLEAALMRPGRPSSGIDWKTLIQAIVDRYAQRLEWTRYLLHSPVQPDNIIDLANKTQNQLRVMLTPYLLTGLLTDQVERSDMDWAIPIYKLCATTHTHSMESKLVSMTDSEKLLLRAVRGTSREICRVVTKMWATGVHAGIDPLLNTKESLDVAEMRRLWTTWAEDLDHLMTWLDWSVWVKCNPECSPEEICYLPTWPINFPFSDPSSSAPDLGRPTGVDFRTMLTERLAENMLVTVEPGRDEWIRPQPKCISRYAPHEF